MRRSSASVRPYGVSRRRLDRAQHDDGDAAVGRRPAGRSGWQVALRIAGHAADARFPAGRNRSADAAWRWRGRRRVPSWCVRSRRTARRRCGRRSRYPASGAPAPARPSAAAAAPCHSGPPNRGGTSPGGRRRGSGCAVRPASCRSPTDWPARPAADRWPPRRGSAARPARTPVSRARRVPPAVRPRSACAARRRDQADGHGDRDRAGSGAALRACCGGGFGGGLAAQIRRPCSAMSSRCGRGWAITRPRRLPRHGRPRVARRPSPADCRGRTPSRLRQTRSCRRTAGPCRTNCATTRCSG